MTERYSIFQQSQEGSKSIYNTDDYFRAKKLFIKLRSLGYKRIAFSDNLFSEPQRCRRGAGPGCDCPMCWKF